MPSIAGKRAVAKWRQTHRDVHLERARKYVRKHQLTHPSDAIYARTKSRARKRGVVFTLTRQWIAEKYKMGHCEVTGIPFGTGPWLASIDQKLPGKGYTPDNAQLVVCIYNFAKHDYSHEDVLTFCGALNSNVSKQ